MTDFNGDIFTGPTLLDGIPGIDGYLLAIPNVIEGIQDGYGQVFQSFTTECPPIIIYYALSMFDNTGVRHFWTDTSVSIDNAPAGPTYIVNTLAIEGIF